MTEAGLRLCRSWPQRLADTQFSPAGFTAIPREAKLRVRCHPPLALRGFDCGRGSSGHVPSHRGRDGHGLRSEEHTSELQSLMRISYAVFRLNKKKTKSYT